MSTTNKNVPSGNSSIQLYYHRYFNENRAVERLSAIKRGEFLGAVLRKVLFEFDNAIYETSVSGVMLEDLVSDFNEVSPKKQPLLTDLKREAVEAVDFVLKIYSERRQKWSSNFLAKLRSLGQTSILDATYITVRDGKKKQILGTLRLIREKDGVLPMEDYLGIRLNADDKIKVEPGNFAIDQAHSSRVWPEIMTHLASQFSNRMGRSWLDAGKENHYYTYADEYSFRLYSLLGFKPVDLQKIEVHPSTKVQNGKILKDGIEWTVMEASQETLNSLFDLNISRMKNRGLPQDQYEDMLERVQQMRFSDGALTISHSNNSGQFVEMLAEGKSSRARVFQNIDLQDRKNGEKYLKIYTDSNDGFYRISIPGNFWRSYKSGQILKFVSNGANIKVRGTDNLGQILELEVEQNGKTMKFFF